MKAVVAMLTDPASALAGNITGEDALYAPTAVRVLASPATEPTTGGAAVLEWPLADLATIGDPVADVEGLRCVVVEGEDWTTLEPLATSADTATHWSSGGTDYTLRFRPLLPAESGC